MRRFDTLFDALNENRGDAAIASIAVTEATRKRSISPTRTTARAARFVGRRGTSLLDGHPGDLEGKKIAVVAGSAHEQYLRTLFTEAEPRALSGLRWRTRGAAPRRRRSRIRRQLCPRVLAQRRKFGRLLRVRGGPFVESRYFGEGIGIAVKHGNDTLRLALNWALFRVWETGRFTDLWLRYFPISPF